MVSTIRQWDRRHWGKGGQEFHWWCTQDPEAFVGRKPVYEEMESELTEMVGATVFQRLLAYLRQRDRLRAQRVALPHPAVRYPKPVATTSFSSVEDEFEKGRAPKSAVANPAPPVAASAPPGAASASPDGAPGRDGTESQPTDTRDAILLPE